MKTAMISYKFLTLMQHHKILNKHIDLYQKYIILINKNLWTQQIFTGNFN